MVSINENTVDWAQLEGEYVNSKESLKALSERYGVPYKTVKNHSATGKWSEKRRKFAEKKAQKVSERLSDRDVKKTVHDIERCCTAAGKLIDKVNAAVRQLDKTVYISLDDIEQSERAEEEPDGTKRVRTVKKRKMQTRQQKTMLDTKRLLELSKALVNIKAVLTGEDGRVDETGQSGVIEIVAANMIDMRQEDEEDMDTAATAGGDDVP